MVHKTYKRTATLKIRRAFDSKDKNPHPLLPQAFFIVLVCTLLLLLAFLLALSLGAVHLSLREIGEGLWGTENKKAQQILYYVRLPRMLAAALCGAGLAVSGVIIQSVLANPLASPSIIGVNTGAGLSVTLCMVLIPTAVWAVPVAAFLGALATVFMVFGIAKRAQASRITVILSGVAVSSLMSAGTNTLLHLFPDILLGLKNFQTGGLTGVTVSQLLPAAILIASGILSALALSNELEVLSLGESTAQSLGLPVRFYRFLFLVIAAALSGASVSFAGLIGFVGLIVPHITKRILKTGSKRMLIAVSALAGAFFLTVCDTAARTLFRPYEMPVGILVSYFGVPFFLWLLFRERRKTCDSHS